MRIHTSDRVTYAHLYQAARVAGVTLEVCDRKSSRTHQQAWEISLRGSSRRRPNFYNGDGQYAATWDQWGVFLAGIFQHDVDARCGGAKRPAYRDFFDFDAKTGGRFGQWELHRRGFVAQFPRDAHGDHTFRFSGTVGRQACTKCSATFRWDI